MADLIIRSRRVLLPGGMRPASVVVRGERIETVASYEEHPGGARSVDAGDLVVMPGLVDTHVHVNDPGRTEWEGFAHATRAAAAGGVTTIVDMPLNSVPATTTLSGLAAKLEAATGQCHVDVGFWGGVVPGNAGEVEPLARRGVLGFKCFLSPSGVDEFEHSREADLRAVLPIVARTGLPLLVHAELPSELELPDLSADPRRYATWLASRPARAEHAAIDLLIELAREFGTRIHVVHLASVDALPALRAARNDGIAISAETCPHYLSFAAEEIPDGATAFKCAPPIREQHHREALWRALAREEIALVATDHSPALPGMKHLDDGDFLAAWGGIASLELGLSAVWTGASSRGIGLEQVARWMSFAPAALAGLSARKGALAAGLDADLVIFDPEAAWDVDPASLHHRHPITPYAGHRLRGRVQATMLRGIIVFDRGRFTSGPRGRFVMARD
jgi:allantoinase